jgi:hypothetical protein
MPNWKKLITSGSDAHLNSIDVATNVTATGFIGNLTGTASYATNIGEIFGYQHTQTTPTGSWIINHSLNTSTPVVQVYDGSNKVILPKEIQSTTPNQTVVTFDYNQGGYAVISKGSGVTNVSVQTASYATFSDVAAVAIDANTALNATSASYANTSQTSTTSTSASYATQALSASYAPVPTTASYALTALSASYAPTNPTASYALASLSASYAPTSATSSYALVALSASYAPTPTTASYAITASYALNGGGTSGGGTTSVTISGSNPGTKDSGSLWWNNNDGNLYIQTQTPTGSIWAPAVNTVAGNISASYSETAQTSSYIKTAQTASFVLNAQSSSFSQTSNTLSTNYIPYYIQAGNNSGQAMPVGLTTITNWTNVTVSTGSAWNATTGVFTVPRTGYYKLRASIIYTANTAPVNSEFNVGIAVNGVVNFTSTHFRTSNSSYYTQIPPAEGILYLTAGNTITFVSYQSGGSTINLWDRADINTITIQELTNYVTK